MASLSSTSPSQSLSAESQTSKLPGWAEGLLSSQSSPLEEYPGGDWQASLVVVASPYPSPSLSAYQVTWTPSSMVPSQSLSDSSQTSAAPG